MSIGRTVSIGAFVLGTVGTIIGFYEFYQNNQKSFEISDRNPAIMRLYEMKNELRGINHNLEQADPYNNKVIAEYAKNRRAQVQKSYDSLMAQGNNSEDFTSKENYNRDTGWSLGLSMSCITIGFIGGLKTFEKKKKLA